MDFVMFIILKFSDNNCEIGDVCLKIRHNNQTLHFCKLFGSCKC